MFIYVPVNKLNKNIVLWRVGSELRALRIEFGSCWSHTVRVSMGRAYGVVVAKENLPGSEPAFVEQ